MGFNRNRMKILYVINSSKFFVSHFSHIASAASKGGHVIYVAAGDDEEKSFIESQGFNFHLIDLERSSSNVFTELKSVFSIIKLIRMVKPRVIHSLTIKPVIYSGFIGKCFSFNSQTRYIFSVTGLGSLSLASSPFKRILWGLVKYLYKYIFSNKNSIVVFENVDDRVFFVSSNLVSFNRSRVINGAGVDVLKFAPSNNIVLRPKIVCVCRLLKDKGVREYIEAGKILREKGVEVELLLVGSIDEQNPSSLSENEVLMADKDNNIRYLGFRNDIDMIYAESSVACLPSYREGLPKSLIEAASCGLPIITTNVPGCRQMVFNGRNGILVDVKCARALADAIETIICNDEMMASMGSESRIIALEYFSNEEIEKKFMTFYGC